MKIYYSTCTKVFSNTLIANQLSKQQWVIEQSLVLGLFMCGMWKWWHQEWIFIWEQFTRGTCTMPELIWLGIFKEKLGILGSSGRYYRSVLFEGSKSSIAHPCIWLKSREYYIGPWCGFCASQTVACEQCHLIEMKRWTCTRLVWVKAKKQGCRKQSNIRGAREVNKSFICLEGKSMTLV